MKPLTLKTHAGKSVVYEKACIEKVVFISIFLQNQLLVANLSQTPYTVQPGDRVAQLMVVPVAAPEIEVVDALPETVRGAGGLGSTGR